MISLILLWWQVYLCGMIICKLNGACPSTDVKFQNWSPTPTGWRGKEVFCSTITVEMILQYQVRRIRQIFTSLLRQCDEIAQTTLPRQCEISTPLHRQCEIFTPLSRQCEISTPLLKQCDEIASTTLTRQCKIFTTLSVSNSCDIIYGWLIRQCDEAAPTTLPR